VSIRRAAVKSVQKLRSPPERINGYRVEEYGFFPQPVLPTGYVPPTRQPPLRPVQNLAICTADEVDGYYLLFCDPDWCYVTFSFDETLKSTKRTPRVEFGQDVAVWHKARRN
jgi:hypothetical protein